MRTNETISKMYSHFTNIVASLGNFGQQIKMKSKIWKILSFLSKNWEAKRTAIEEAQNLETLTIEELIGSLLVYEVE